MSCSIPHLTEVITADKRCDLIPLPAHRNRANSQLPATPDPRRLLHAELHSPAVSGGLGGIPFLRLRNAPTNP